MARAMVVLGVGGGQHTDRTEIFFLTPGTLREGENLGPRLCFCEEVQGLFLPPEELSVSILAPQRAQVSGSEKCSKVWDEHRWTEPEARLVLINIQLKLILNQITPAEFLLDPSN